MQGQRIMSELDFAAEFLPKDIKILAVTGTNGKSTVVTFAGQVLQVPFSLYVCMYACMHVCMHACMHVYVFRHYNFFVKCFFIVSYSRRN